MYTDHQKKNGWIIAAAGVLIAIALVVGGVFIARSAKPKIDEDTALSITEAIENAAHQCYAVEGIYPPDLQYLEDHYGIRVNHRDYYVIYEAFASNLPPTVRVVRLTK